MDKPLELLATRKKEDVDFWYTMIMSQAKGLIAGFHRINTACTAIDLSQLIADTHLQLFRDIEAQKTLYMNTLGRGEEVHIPVLWLNMYWRPQG